PIKFPRGAQQFHQITPACRKRAAIAAIQAGDVSRINLDRARALVISTVRAIQFANRFQMDGGMRHKRPTDISVSAIAQPTTSPRVCVFQGYLSGGKKRAKSLGIMSPANPGASCGLMKSMMNL